MTDNPRDDAPPELVAASGRFEAKVMRLPHTDCWYWYGALNPEGYGLFRCTPYRPAAMVAHRVAYLLWCGPLDDGLEVHHLCHVRRCVNPEHLAAITKHEHRRNHRRARAKRAATASTAGPMATDTIRPTLRSALGIPERWSVT